MKHRAHTAKPSMPTAHTHMTAYGCSCVSKRYLAGDAALLAMDAKACGDAP